MAETLLKILEKTPELAGLIVIVYLFLKSQSEARSEYLANLKDIHGEQLKAFDQIHKENLEARTIMRDVIKENTKATNDLTAAVRSLEVDMRRS